MEADNVRKVSHKFSDVYSEIGQVDAIEYTTIRDNEEELYRHDFKENARPVLGASHGGDHVALIGGKYDFGDAGIDDH